MEETKSCGSDTCPIAKKETPKEVLCTALYQTAKMGSDAILALLEKLGQSESPLRAELAAQLEQYQNFAARATNLMVQSGQTPSNPPLGKTVSARLGMNFSTLSDKSDSKLAEMIMTGCLVGVIDITRAEHRCPAPDKDAPLQTLCADLLGFLEGSSMQMKTYL